MKTLLEFLDLYRLAKKQSELEMEKGYR